MALTMTQIKEICDYVYNQATTYDVYTSNNNPMRLYYITVTDQGAKIYKKGEDIVTIFGKRNLPYTDDTEIKSYTADVVYNSLAPTATEEKVNFRGVGANISVKTLIRNIGVFLGVKIADNINKVNPTMYNEMVEICRSHVDNVNKIPYFLAKDTHNGITYQSFVPLDILVDMAIYLNDSGIFTQEREIINPGIYYKYTEITSQETYDIYKDYVKPISEFYPNNYDKATFYDKLYNYFSYDRLQIWQQVLRNGIDAFIATFDNLVNYDNILMFNIECVTQGTDHIANILVREFPKSCYIQLGQDSFFRNGSDDAMTAPSSSKFVYYNNIKNFQYKKYTISYNHDQQTITQSYNVYENTKDTYYNLGEQYITKNWFSNVKFTDNIKVFCDNLVNSNISYLPLDYFGRLNINTWYERDIIKLCGITPFYMESSITAKLIEDNITDLDLNNDLLIYSRNPYTSKYYLFRFKSIENIKFNFPYMGLPINFSVLIQASKSGEATNPWVYYDRIMNYIYYYSVGDDTTLTNTIIQFNKDIDIEIYEVNKNDLSLTLIDSTTTNSYTFPLMDNYNLYYSYSNLGSIVQHEVIDKYEGIELESGANYPITVVDKQSFMTFYNNRLYNYVGNPDIEDGEIVNNKVDTIFVNCSVSETPPASQSDSESWNVDNATPKDQEKIADDIDSSANDKDEDDDGNNDDGKDDATDSGEVEEIPVELVPNTLIGSLRQYKMNASEMINFSAGLSALDFGDVVEALIYGNPINGVVNMATTYDGLWNSTNSQDNTQVKVWNNNLENDSTPVTATLVTQPIKEIDLGTINLATNTEIQEFVHDNYTDLTDCEIGLYLPFVGIINIDIHDFYKKELTLKARVDSTTGTIIYNVYSEGDNFKHLIYTCSGNCQSKIPLKSEDMSQLLRNIGNATAGIGGAILGGFV